METRRNAYCYMNSIILDSMDVRFRFRVHVSGRIGYRQNHGHPLSNLKTVMEPELEAPVESVGMLRYAPKTPATG